MRSDMAKVICERPRVGGTVPKTTVRARKHGEELPRSERMGFGGTKHFGEHLGPLRKYVVRQVGRPWKKVYGEIRENLTPGNTTHEHILLHLYDYIAVHVEKCEPSVAAPCGVARKPDSEWRRWRGPLKPMDLYVDPDDGLIKRARRKLKGPPPPKISRALKPPAPSLDIAKVAGRWFVVDLGDYRRPKIEPTAVPPPGAPQVALVIGDQVVQRWTDPGFATERDGAVRRGGRNTPKSPITKRQLSGRELKRYGLSND